MSRTRVLLADDHTIFLDALAKLLEPEFEVVGTVNDGRALVLRAPDLRPDVVVLDIGMPLLNGLDAGQQIKALRPETKLIFLTQNQDANLAAEAFRQKASGYLLKNSAATELITAIRPAYKTGGTDLASTRSIAAPGRGQVNERGRKHPERKHADGRIPQAAADGRLRP
jgi:DNA-binding NarL/FixJ family response regulator